MKRITICLAALLQGIGMVAQNPWGHVIPEVKNMSEAFKKSLYSNDKKTYQGEELKTIGMPCGGIAAGQLYVRGDGSLANWWIANNGYNTGYGIAHLLNFNTAQGPWKVCYQTFEPFSYIDQFFEVTVRQKKNVVTKKLNKEGFDAIEFLGEYPVATVTYKDKAGEFPLEVSMDVFSPFIPLDLKRSATPATVLKFTLKNTSKKAMEVDLKGVLQNMVMRDLKGKANGVSRNVAFNANGLVGVNYDFEVSDQKFNMHPYNGNMTLALLNEQGVADADCSTAELDGQASKAQTAEGNKLNGSVSTTFNLKKGEEKEVTYVLSWYFPNRPMNYGWGGNWSQPIPTEGPIIGNMYSNWFDSSENVAEYLVDNLDNLTKETYKFKDVWYNQSNLPYWLRQRVMMPVSTLATETCQWWANDKFWSWEGVGSCVGTCTHVWNYAQAQAFLFPELERNVREKTDFGTSFSNDGAVQTRNGWGGVHFDGHAGAILKTYREHLLSKNNIFLSRNYDKVKKATEFLFAQDGNGDGLIEGNQPNTYDISFMGANTYVGSLYLAALRAAEEMALLMDDKEFADKCRKVFESGKRLSVERLWNGKYFKQDVDLKKYPKNQYANGCLSDQLFGQTWAHLLNLGYIYEESKVKGAIDAIWRYNWAPDVGIHNKKFVPERTYADAGEAGLLNCTYPISKHLNQDAVRYRNEVWTGIEYQVATNMIYEGRLEEALSVVRAVHDRYSPEKHNPWNEIECGDHYARALASWGVMIALEDYFYDGPKGMLSYQPKLNKEDFKGFFSAAEAWGLITQQVTDAGQENAVEVQKGVLRLNELRIVDNHSNDVRMQINGKDRDCLSIQREDGMLLIKFDEISLKEGDKLFIRQ